MLSRAYIYSADWMVMFLTSGKTDEEMSKIMQKLRVFNFSLDSGGQMVEKIYFN